MHFTKKIDRARQWAGEKMGGEARTSLTDEFKDLEGEMNLRQQGMERLQKSTTSYVRWLNRRCDGLEDKERSSPIGYFARSVAAHGEEFEPESQLGNSLVAVGQANERVAALQETYAEQLNESWVANLERNLAMMKEYQTARKKLESRRLAFDASNAKLTKARRDDFRIEEEVRNNKVKFEESSEDVLRRMQDIKDAEAEGVAAINEFLDFELDYHERCAEELRRARAMVASSPSTSQQYGMPSPPRLSPSSRPGNRSRSNTARSWQEPRNTAVYEEAEPEPLPVRKPTISNSLRGNPQAPPQPPRPSMPRSWTSEGRPIPKSTAPPLPLTRVRTDVGAYNSRAAAEDVFADDASTASGSASTDYGDLRTLSPATSYGSLSHAAAAASMGRKAPPPPVNRAKKPPPPPVPARRADLNY